MASDRPEAEEERREVEDVIEEVEESEEGLGSPESSRMPFEISI